FFTVVRVYHFSLYLYKRWTENGRSVSGQWTDGNKKKLGLT
ncbi:MAG: hypothetical protein ACI90V_007309, partial [Bacillariaceae sp.]